MPLLVEILNPQSGVTFLDDSEFEFINDSEFVFEDSDSNLRLSTENFAGSRYWSGDILSIEPIAWRADNPHGGLVRIVGAGSIEIAMSAFDSADWWLPAASYRVEISYTTGLEADAVRLMNGTLYRSGANLPLSFTFDVYPKEYTTELLSTAANYDGETVVLPVAIGNVTHVTPVRMADAGGGNRRYSAGGLTGTKHTNWHIYDDGVDVCSNAVEIAANVIEYTVTPAGNLTISGTGAARTLPDVITLYCGESWLNIPFENGFYSYPGATYIDRWVDSQVRVIDFLSEITAALSQLIYIDGGVLYGVTQGYGYQTLSYDIATDTLDGTRYTRLPPVKIAKYQWKKRMAVEETIGKYVKEIDQEESVTGTYTYAYGSDLEIDTYTETRSYANLRLAYALGFHSTDQYSIQLPLPGELVLPGSPITIIDDRYSAAGIYLLGVARDIVFDFLNKKMTLEGTGVMGF